MPVPISDAAVIAVYLNAEGYEVQREVLTAQVKQDRQIEVDPDYIEPFRVMTLEITCLPGDVDVFAAKMGELLPPPDGDPTPGVPAYSKQLIDPTKLRYVFDTQFPVPLALFGDVIRSMVQDKPSRCNTLRMMVCGGCIAPCKPKTCNRKASCGWAAGCPC